LDPCAQLTQFGALRGDHFAEETGGEKHGADRNAGLDKIHEWAKSHAADDTPQDGYDSNNHADDEKHRAQQSE
jgi:hypothetical protein